MTPQSPFLDPKLLAAIDSLGDARAVTLLNAVASAQAHSEGPTLEWSAELGRALCAEFEVAPASSPASSATLAREALKLLAADAKYAGPVRMMIDGLVLACPDGRKASASRRFPTRTSEFSPHSFCRSCRPRQADTGLRQQIRRRSLPIDPPSSA